MGVSEYSTGQVARKLGIRTPTLLRWVHRGLINPKPEYRVLPGGVPAYIWTLASIRSAVRVQRDSASHKPGPKPKAGRPTRSQSS